ncbi:MAG: 50S ribosomal protein L11 methyltransferase [Fuerstia sp.]|nr:50S ribosomal protein L11 methyltransferase [Fuerstiella sp.]
MTLQLTRQTLSIADHEIVVELPSSQNQLLEEALQQEIAGASDCDPYWGTLWATAPTMAAIILRHTWLSRLKVLELGCGLGVTGIAALIAGHDVTFADHASSAVRLAVSNAALNGFADTIGMVFEWQEPTTDQFDFIIASDVLYDAAGCRPLLNTLQAMLRDQGVVWIGDPGRGNALSFTEFAVQHGWSVAALDEFAQPCPNPAHMQFRLMVLQRRGS